MTAIELVRMREKVALDPKHDDKDREIVSEILKLIYGNSQDDYSLYKTMQADILLGREFESDPDYSFTYSHTEDTEIIRLCEDAHNYAVDHADDLSSTVMQLEEEVNRVIPIEKEYREILNHHPSDEAIPMLLEWAGKYGFSLPKDAYPIKTVFDGCFYDTPEKDKRNPYSIFCKWFSENIDLEELHRNECRLAYCKALLKRGSDTTENKIPVQILELFKIPLSRNTLQISNSPLLGENGSLSYRFIALCSVAFLMSDWRTNKGKTDIPKTELICEWVYTLGKDKKYHPVKKKTVDNNR